MPTVVDEDENAYFVQPDDGGIPVRMAKTPGLLESLGMAPPAVDVGTEAVPGLPAAEPMAATPAQPEVPWYANPNAPPSVFGKPDPNATPLFDPARVEQNIQGSFGGAQAQTTPVPPIAVVGPPATPEIIAQQSATAAASPPPQASTPAAGATQETAPAPQPGTQPAAPSGLAKAQKEHLAAMERERDAAQKVVDIKAHSAEMEKAALDGMAAEHAAHEVRRAAIEKTNKENHDKEMGSLTKLQSDYQKSTVDPDHLWKQKGTGAQIVSIIGRALGAWGAAMNGGPNYAQKLIDDAINRDISAQKDEIAKKGKAVDDQKNTIAMLKSQGMDDLQAENAAYILGLESAKMKLQSSIAADAPAEVKARGAQALEQMNQQIAARKEAYSAATTKKLSINDQIKIAEHNMKVNDQRNNLRLPFLGDNVYALNEQDRKAVAEGYQKHQDFLAPATELKALLGKHGTQAFGTHAADMQQLGQQIKLKIKNNEELGTLDKGSEHFLDSMIRDPNSLVRGGDGAARLIGNLERMSAKKFGATLKRAGLNDHAAMVEKAAPAFSTE